MNDINQDIPRMIVEMRELGKLPAPCKGGSHNNLLRYNKLRDRILDKFLSAFDEGYRLKNSNRPPEGKSMENEKLFLALRAGARAIVNNKRLHGELYFWDIWGENGGPKDISYLEAATLMAETADKMEERPPEGEEDT